MKPHITRIVFKSHKAWICNGYIGDTIQQAYLLWVYWHGVPTKA